MELPRHRRAPGSAEGLKFCHTLLTALQRDSCLCFTVSALQARWNSPSFYILKIFSASFNLLQRQLRTREKHSLSSSCHEIGSGSSHRFTAGTAAPEMMRVVDPAVSLCRLSSPASARSHTKLTTASLPWCQRDTEMLSKPVVLWPDIIFDIRFWGVGLVFLSEWSILTVHQKNMGK